VTTRAESLTTERLSLRRFTPDDLDWLAALYGDPEVTRHLGGVKSRAQTQDFLDARILNYYDEHPGLGIWMTVDRGTGNPVGFHLLNHIRGESIIQVGYALAGAINSVPIQASVPTNVTPPTKDPGGNIRIGAQATTKINRQDFGIVFNKTLDGGGVLVGDEISITIDVEVIKKGA